ncbi:peptidase M50 [Candidatus Nitrosymbiomonas proteolyticus]|uniref:Peptidase M50 n=1 Tax=Candidatus Nitrosymbiomonas proteolyticus TaxID=2608984 RepID=A0A809R4B8_9BACT|nr:peptidase M50 [Candidatus Nitrosymbiomonas proteolyticus]
MWAAAISILAFITVITLLVAAHEYGHYLFARLFRMEVEEFAIGLGRPILLRRPSKSAGEFTIRAWPVGGFVRIKGMEPQEDGSEVNIPNGFYSRGPWSRFWVLLAGPLFSLAAGILILAGVFAASGVNRPLNEPVIGMIVEQGAAFKAGVRLNDRVLSVDSQPVNTFYELVAAVRDRPGEELEFVVDRGGERQVFRVTPERDTEPTAVLGPDLFPTMESKVQGKIGAQWGHKKVRLGPIESVVEATLYPVKMVEGLFGMAKNPNRIKTEGGGPISIFMLISATVQQGLTEALTFAGLLSMSLGIFNLLPIPPLDGGQMSIAFVEILRGGRRLKFAVQTWVHSIGLVLVLVMVLGFVGLDFSRLLGPKKEITVHSASEKKPSEPPAERAR